MTAFHGVSNDFRSTFAAGYTAGSGSIAIANAAGLPGSTPYFLTAITAASIGDETETKTIFEVTGRSGLTLTVAAVAGETDRNYSAGDYLELRVVAGVVSELQSAVNAAETSLAGKADAAHTHDASALVSGVVATTRLGSGTADSTKFLRGDQTWTTVTATVPDPLTVATVQGSTASGGTLAILATSHATKGKISAYGSSFEIENDPISLVVRRSAGQYYSFDSTSANQQLLSYGSKRFAITTAGVGSPSGNNAIALTPENGIVAINDNASQTLKSALHVVRFSGHDHTFMVSSSQSGIAEGDTFTITYDSNFAFGSLGSFGGGVRVLFLANATTLPTSNPTGGGLLYVDSGALKYRGSSGTVTTLAPA